MREGRDTEVRSRTVYDTEIRRRTVYDIEIRRRTVYAFSTNRNVPTFPPPLSFMVIRHSAR